MQSDSLENDVAALKSFSPGASVLFYIDVTGIDEIYNDLKNRVEIAKELKNDIVRQTRIYIKDCNGYILGFGERE